MGKNASLRLRHVHPVAVLMSLKGSKRIVKNCSSEEKKLANACFNLQNIASVLDHAGVLRAKHRNPIGKQIEELKTQQDN